MSMQGPRTADWFERARASLVNGVSSGFRYLGDDDTLVIDRGQGGYVWDMDGKRYIDLQCAWGPIILGHADPFVTEAVVRTRIWTERGRLDCRVERCSLLASDDAGFRQAQVPLSFAGADPGPGPVSASPSFAG